MAPSIAELCGNPELLHNLHVAASLSLKQTNLGVYALLEPEKGDAEVCYGILAVFLENARIYMTLSL